MLPVAITGVLQTAETARIINEVLVTEVAVGGVLFSSGSFWSKSFMHLPDYLG